MDSWLRCVIVPLKETSADWRICAQDYYAAVRGLSGFVDDRPIPLFNEIDDVVLADMSIYLEPYALACRGFGHMLMFIFQ